MELRGLGADFSTIRSDVEYINLQWTRRYYECGEFSVQIRMADYDQRIKYLYTPDRPEFAVIEKLVTTQDITYPEQAEAFLETLEKTTGLFGIVFSCYTGNSAIEKYVVNKSQVSAALGNSNKAASEG